VLNAVDFQKFYLGRRLWSKQKELCAAIAKGRSVSVKGCHGSGKTYTVAGMVPYEMLAHEESVVLTVAPTLRQVKLMWSEIETAIQALPVKCPERTSTGWELSEKCKAIGFSSSKGVNAQGFHGKRVLIIADEAIGIAGDMWDAIEGIRAAGDVRLVKLCNPTVPSGAPYEDFTRLRGSTECITISAFDTPNLAGLTMEQLLQLPDDQLDYAPFPWLTRRRWVKEMYFKWGPTNPRFLSRVLGEFPTQADDSVFQLPWVEKAGLPYDEEAFAKELSRYADQKRAFIQVGLDIAGPGEDETSLTARIGPYVVKFAAWSKADPLEDVLKVLGDLKSRFPGLPMAIMADVVGIGFHFARSLAREGFDVREFKAGDPPLDPRQFRNAKADAYFHARELFRNGDVRGVVDEDTKAQLSDIRYRELANGTVEIEHKDEARARGSSSPDRAESLIMAFARLVPKQQTVIYGGYQDLSI
jgi:phage terminase large subunit